jgi:hypothetical protein
MYSPISSPPVPEAPITPVASAEPLASLPGPESNSQEEVAVEPPQEPPLDHPALRRHAELNRYADTSRRIDENSVDLLEPNARYESWQPLAGRDSREGPRFSVLFTADRYAVRGEETAELRLSLRRDGVEVPIRNVSLEAAPVGPVLSGSSLETVGMDVERDRMSRRATLDPDALWPEYVGRVIVTARFRANGLGEQTGTLAFQVTPANRIPARFDGRFSDSVRNGDLLVEVGLLVDTPGLYRIEANLHDDHGAPVAWARFQGALEPGLRSAPIVFDGLILNDVDARGPYTLRTLRGYRMRPGDVPHREDMRDWPLTQQLQGRYVASDFRNEPRVSPRDQRMDSLMRDAIARGVRLGEPSRLTTGPTR